jgi:mono/diheme cytochrome c family protein
MLRCALLMGWTASALVPLALADEPGPAERGRTALQTRAFTPAMWPQRAYDDLWKTWGEGTQPPADYARAVREHYGLHPAPFANGKYPMGLREAPGVLVGKGLTADCMLCHGGSILGQSYVGLGNSALDIQALFEDMAKAGGSSLKLPFAFTNVRGTSEAGNFAVFLLTFREPDLKVRIPRRKMQLREHLCEDVPAWWLLKKKRTMYFTGTTHARSVRSIMQFMLLPTVGPEVFAKEEPTFADIQAYLLSLSPPKYPFPIDRALAKKGEALFNRTCASCHGTYGEKWTYPNKIVPIDEIGTDRTRFEGFADEWGAFYNESWFAREKRPGGKVGYPVTGSVGYQAPPLDGIWATAPYFHNGSVPTVYHVLNSKARPKIFTRSFRTDREDYDEINLGWKLRVRERGPDPGLPAHERRKVYDTTQPGRGNGGHPFGDDLSEEQRRAVIEYLKTL